MIVLILQFAGVIYFSLDLVILLGLGLWILDAVLLLAGSHSFRRGELMARL